MPRSRPLAIVLVSGVISAAACGGAPHAVREDDRPPLSVGTEVSAPAPWGPTIEAIGTIEPARRASPGTILAGRITRIEKREGDRVRAGETLAAVESGDVGARVAQAEAAAGAARAQSDNARRMRQRMERLVARQAASQKSLEDAIAEDEAASAGLRAAEEGVRAARVQLAYASVTAPFDGVIARRMIEVGDVVGPGLPLYVVDDAARVKVDATLAEAAARDLTPGHAVVVMVDGAPGGEREATLAEILPAADPRTRTVTARVLLDNAEGELRPGAFAHVRFPAGNATPVLAVSEDAIVTRGPLSGVFIVDSGGVARLRWLTLGTRNRGRVEVLTGLAAGEAIVVDPPADLTDGRRVQVAR